MSKKIFLHVFFTIGITIPCLSQGGIGFQIWPNPDSCEVFHVSPPVRIPIMRFDMPWDVGLAYMVIDTICKTYSPQEIMERIPLLSNDSLLLAWHMFNRIYDYDPFLLIFQYRYSLRYAPADYRSGWGDPTWQLAKEYYKRFLGVNDYQGVDTNIPAGLIGRAEGIYRVRAMAQLERSDSMSWYRLGPCLKVTQCADVEVLEVYKGRKYYSSCNPGEYDLPQGTGCIRYSWDLLSCDSTEWKLSNMIPGHEYLVFQGYFSAENRDGPYRWTAAPVKRFEIVGGNLLDPERYFKREELIPFGEIESLVRNTMNNLTGR